MDAAVPSFPRPSDLKQRPTRLTVCGLCRRPFDKKVLPATDDHIAPRGFFGDPPPPNLPTWLVCGACQDDLDPREERLRNLFAGAHSHHPEELVTVYDRAGRSGQPPVTYGRKLVEAPNGMMVPAPIAIPAQDDLDIVFRKIATGLYWYREGKLPADPRFVVRLMSATDHRRWSDILMPDCPVQHLGSEFWWMTGYNRQDPGWNVWLFVIHGAVPIGVWHGDAVTLPVPHPAGIALRE